MLERTVVFVDTSYLLASFYNSWEIGARAQLEIDLPEVVATMGNMIEQQLGHPVHRQNWYDGIPDTGPHRYQRALRTCDGVQLRTGQLIEWGERRTQKAVDTRLVADMVVAAMNQHVTDFVLVSGDADMIPGVQEATNNGIRVHLYGFGWDSMSSALRHACDSTTILDPREDFSEAMEIQVLEGPLPPTIREQGEGSEDTDTATAAAEPAGEPEATAERGEHEPSEVEAAFGAQPQSGASAAVDAVPGEPGSKAKAGAGADAAESSATPSTPTPGTMAPKPGPQAGTAQPKTPMAAAEQPGPTASAADSAPVPGPSSSSRGAEGASSNSADSAEKEENQARTEQEPSAPSPGSAPKPSMMAPRRKLRSRYVPLPEEVWSSAGFQTPYDVGQQYASWWFDNAATADQRDQAHLLSGGGLPPEIDRPLLQFACETLHEYTLSESQRVNLRDGFHSGIRGVLINIQRMK